MSILGVRKLLAESKITWASVLFSTIFNFQRVLYGMAARKKKYKRIIVPSATDDSCSNTSIQNDDKTVIQLSRELYVVVKRYTEVTADEREECPLSREPFVVLKRCRIEQFGKLPEYDLMKQHAIIGFFIPQQENGTITLSPSPREKSYIDLISPEEMDYAIQSLDDGRRRSFFNLLQSQGDRQ